MCSFWLVEAMTRAGMAIRRCCIKRDCCLSDAGIFESFGIVCGADEFAGGDAGNFPQAFTHLALISGGV